MATFGFSGPLRFQAMRMKYVIIYCFQLEMLRLVSSDRMSSSGVGSYREPHTTPLGFIRIKYGKKNYEYISTPTAKEKKEI